MRCLTWLQRLKSPTICCLQKLEAWESGGIQSRSEGLRTRGIMGMNPSLSLKVWQGSKP